MEVVISLELDERIWLLQAQIDLEVKFGPKTKALTTEAFLDPEVLSFHSDPLAISDPRDLADKPCVTKRPEIHSLSLHGPEE